MTHTNGVEGDRFQEVTDTILEAMNMFATHVDEKFAKIDERFARIDEQFVEVKGDISGIKGELVNIHRKIDGLEQRMVTKDFLTDRIFDAEGRMGIHLRKENDKIDAVTETLVEKHVFDRSDAVRIKAVGPRFM